MGTEPINKMSVVKRSCLNKLVNEEVNMYLFSRTHENHDHMENKQ